MRIEAIVATLAATVLVTSGAACRPLGRDAASGVPTATVAMGASGQARPPTTAATAQTEDFERTLRELLARRDEAYERNDLALIDAVETPDCPCRARARAAIEAQAREGVHASGPRLRVHSAHVFERPSPSTVVLGAVLEQPPYQLVRADGTYVRDGRTEPPSSYVFTLVLVGGAWRIAGMVREGPLPLS